MLDPLLASKWGHLVDPLPTTLDPNLNLIKATRCHNDGRIRTQAARIASEFFIPFGLNICISCTALKVSGPRFSELQ